MRMAPVGLARRVEDPFRIGCELAALTHGDPSGYLSAGLFAFVIRELLCGSDLEPAVREALEELEKHPGHEECKAAVERALAKTLDGDRSPQAVEDLGEGWVAEEALAMSLYCALSFPDDLESAVLLAVNHSGDSDSTGAITGNILGALLGEGAIPPGWRDDLELRDVIEGLAEDLFITCRYDDERFNKYPGW